MSNAKPIAPSTAAVQKEKRALEQMIYHAVMEFSPWPMAEVEGVTHLVQAMNPAFCALLEKTQEEVLGKPLSQLFTESHPTHTLLEGVLNTGDAATHVESARNSAGPIYWAYTCWPVKANDAHHVGLMIQVTETNEVDQQTKDMNEALLISSVQQHELTDVADRLNVRLLKEMAERAQAEKLLRQNHDTFSNLIKNAPFGVLVIDAQFRVQQISAAAVKVFSNVRPLIERDYGEVLRIIWPEPLASEVIGHFRHTLATGEPYAQKNTTEQRLDIPEVESYDWRIERLILPDGQFGVVGYFYDISESKRLENDLRASEEFNRSITESSPDCIKILDVHGNLLSMSDRGQKLLCIPDLKPYLNTPWMEFYAGEEDRAAATLAVKTAAEGGEGNFIGFFPTLDGENKWWDVRISPIHEAGDTINRLLAVSRDVTDRKLAELNLAFLASISNDLLLLSNLDEMMNLVGEKIGTYLGLSVCAFVEIHEGGDQAIVTHDWHRDEGRSFVGTHRMEDFFTPEFQAAGHAGETFVVNDTATDPRASDANFAAFNVGALITVPLLQGGIWRFMLCAYHSKAHHWRTDEVELVREITTRIWARLESLRAEAAVRQMDARLQLALDSAQLGTWNLDPERGEFSVDERYQAIFGIELSKLTRAQELETVHPDDRDRVSGTLEDAMLLGADASIETEYRVAHPDGTVRWVLSSGRMLFQNEGTTPSLQGFAGTVADITKRRELELAFEKTVTELAETDRRKSEFLATLAHELRNPLAPLVSGVEILALPNCDPETAERTRAMMGRQLQHMVRLIDDLMDLSRVSRGVVNIRKERMDLRPTLTQAADTVRSMYEKQGHTLVVRLPEEVLWVEGDANRLLQVFGNLLTNAAKFTEPGGTITVRAELRSEEVVVSVEDNGIGIAEDELGTLFDMFVQVDSTKQRVQGGLGIGLNIVKHMVKLHGGRIEVLSAGLGCGTCFTVFLPRAAAMAAAPTTAPPQQPAAPVTFIAQRILVVDDNQDAANLVSHMLTRAGHVTQVAYSGAQALELGARMLPTVVLMDIGMPEMDGNATCRSMRQTPWGQPAFIAALTGWGNDDDRHHTEQAGFDDHLVKPIGSADLMALLATVKATTPR